MDALLYLVARAFVAVLQAMPLRWVARFGRAIGALVYCADARHRRVTLANLTRCFEREKSPEEIRGIARENFRRIGENFACALKTATMNTAQIRPHLRLAGHEKLARYQASDRPRNVVAAIGHFGNFELFARFGEFFPLYRGATTYRGLRQPGLNRIMQALRGRSGTLFFERRTDAAALKSVMAQGNVLLGLLADQHAGAKGARIPFFGVECSTTTAPAVFALRYQSPLWTGYCFRTGMAQWELEVGEEIPTHNEGQPRRTEDIMRDVNAAFERAVRRDPANWFWVHNRWKAPRPTPEPAPTAVLSEAEL
jgi:KDO2-lipid IV(A) lauroyltransferase